MPTFRRNPLAYIRSKVKGSDPVPFQYNPFDKPMEVRLLRLQPSPSSPKDDQRTRTLSIKLLTVLLDHAPSYLALSYAWGDPAPHSPVLCDGKILLLTPSLHLALSTVSSAIGRSDSTLWEKGEAIWLWADGVCMNQQDDAEKSAQVRIMGDIYRKARGVVGYAGPSRHGRPRDAMLGLLSFLNETMKVTLLPDEKPGSSLSLLGWEKSDMTEEVMLDFWECPWLTRGWVTQELALAVGVCILFGCADDHAVWPLSSVDYISSSLQECLTLPSSFMRSRYGLAYKSRNNYAFQIDFRREIAQSPQGISLVEALLLNQWTNVSNAKDIVYCVLGLVVAEDKKAMRVDYSTKYRTNDLFLDIARPLAESGNGIVLLLFADKSRMLDLPSWCPDWSRSTRDAFWVFEPSFVTMAAPGAISDDGLRLSLEGYEVDQIGNVGLGFSRVDTSFENYEDSFASNADPESDSIIRRCLFIERCATRMCGVVPSTSGDRQTVQDIVGRTITFSRFRENTGPNDYRTLYAEYLDVISSPDQNRKRLATGGFQAQDKANEQQQPEGNQLESHKLDWRQLVARINTMEDGKDVLTRLKQFSVLVEDCLTGRKLATTIQSRFGVIPAKSKIGDVVAIFLGDPTPFVLRPIKHGHYQLIGRCCFHDMIDEEGYIERLDLRPEETQTIALV